MKKQIVQVSVLQSSKVVAGIYLVLAIPAAILAALFTSMLQPGPVSMGALLLFPMLYAFCGFIGAVIAGWVYNLVAARIGGIEFTTAEVGALQR